MTDLFDPAHRAERLALPAPRRRGGAGRVIVLLVLVSVIGGGAWFALTGPASPEHLKSVLERSVSRATGRRFSITGPFHVGLGLETSVRAEGIVLANVAGGSRPAMITAQAFTARISLLSLLAGDVVVEDATLEKPDIILEEAQDGTPNWQMHRPRHALFEGAPQETASEPRGAADSVSVHRISVEGGTITYRPPTGPTVAAQIDTLVLSSEGGATPMHGKISGQSAGVAFSGTINSGSFERLQGGAITALAGAWPLTIALQAPGATLKVDGGVNHPDEMRGYQFLITGNVQDLTPLYPWLPKALALPLHDVNFTTRLTDGGNGERRVSGLSLHAGPSDLGTAVPGLVLKEAVLSAPGPGQQVQLNVDGIFQGAPLRLAGTANQPDTLAANVPVPVAISGQAASASLSLRGTVPANWNGLGFDLQVTIRAPNLADLSPLVRRPLPDVRDMVFDAHVGDAGFRLRGLQLREMSLASSLGDLTGTVTAAWSPVPTLTGSLNAKKFDLDGLQAAIATFNTPAPPTAADLTPAPAAVPPAPDAAVPPVAPAEAPPPHLISDTPLPFAALHDADADLTLNAGRLTFGGDSYRDLQAHLSAQGGKLVLNPFRVTAPQGILIGGLTLDASAEPPPVALTLRAPSMSASRLASLLGYPGGASGQVQMDVQLSGAGDTPHLLAASASGHVGLTMVNGQFTDALFRNAVGAALSTAGVPPISGSADVRCLALRARLSHGRGEVEAMALDTSRLSMTGTGNFDLDGETLALHLKPSLRLGGTAVASPVSLTGPFGSLKASPDAAMDGGRFGITIGGPAPDDSACASQLAAARGGMPGPIPMLQAPQSSGSHKKPIDLLRGLFH